MPAVRIRLDHPGIAEVLNSAEVAAAIAGLAASVAANARSDGAVARNGVPVEVSTYTTDRSAASVALAHPAGLAIEAKHGSLIRAAGAAGLEVHGHAD